MAEEVQESGMDPQIKDVLSTTGTVVWWICWPIGISLYYVGYYLAFTILFIVKLVYRPLEFVLLPVIYLGQFLLACVAVPFRLLAKFEVSWSPILLLIAMSHLITDNLHLFWACRPSRSRTRSTRQLRSRIAEPGSRIGL